MMFRCFVPKQAVGANLVYFDVFNPASSGFVLELLQCQPVVSGAVAVTGVVGVDVLLTRTSAVGTGGTAAAQEGTDTTAMAINAHDHSAKLPGGVTGRLTPTGGATAGAVISWDSPFSEETNAGTYVVAADLARPAPDLPGVTINEGTGFRVVQGAVASVGNIGFNVLFNVRPKA